MRLAAFLFALVLGLLLGAPGLAASAASENGRAPSENSPPADPTAATLDAALEGADLSGTPPAPPPWQTPPGEVGSDAEATPGEPPDYDGRPPPPADAADVLIWVPRLVFLPLHLLFEYAVRRPIVVAGTWAEKHHVFDKVSEAVHWDAGNAVILPRAFVDFGFEPHVGLTFWWRDILPGNDVRAAFSAWDDALYTRLGTTTRLLANDSLALHTAGGYTRRADNVYVPPTPGPSYCLHVEGCRYFSAIGEAHTDLDFSLDELDHLVLSAAYRHVELANGGEPPRLPNNLAQTLPGFPGYQLLTTRLDGWVDTRDPDVRFVGQSGVRLELMGSASIDPHDPLLRFVRYGGEASVFWNVGWNNVLGLSVFLALTENLSGRDLDGQRRPLPLPEKVLLGDLEHMPGLTEGKVRGADAWAVSMQYVWPIWWAIDARLFADLGAAHANIAAADAGELHFDYGAGLRRQNGPQSAIEALFAIGSSRFDRTGGIDPAESVRLTLGINHGF